MNAYVLRFLRGFRRNWWVVLVAAVLLGGAGAYVGASGTPQYSAGMTFYVSTPQISQNTAQSVGQYAEDRVKSYATLASSQRLALEIKHATGVSLSTAQIAAEVSGTAPSGTVLLDITVLDPKPSRALEIARGVATELPKLVAILDKSNTGEAPATLTVVTSPNVSKSPVPPDTRVDAILGALLGLAVGVVIVLAIELLDTSVDATSFEEVTTLAVLGQIRVDDAPRRKADTSFAASGRLGIDPAQHAEEFRHLRTSLQFLDASRRLASVVVTSPSGPEGKSSVAANLALACADGDRRVLLIDADLRTPGISGWLERTESPGLTSVLVQESSLADALYRLPGTDLTVLTSGPLPPNPSELLASTRMAELLLHLHDQFDLILIDTPAALPVTDAVVTAAVADGALLVVRHGRTSKVQARRVVSALRGANARLLGGVVNMSPASALHYAGYYER